MTLAQAQNPCCECANIRWIGCSGLPLVPQTARTSIGSPERDPYDRSSIRHPSRSSAKRACASVESHAEGPLSVTRTR